MKKTIVIFAVFLFSATQTFAYMEKVYDEYGNRVGSARRIGDSYEWYDKDNKRVNSYKDLANGAEVFVGTLPARPMPYYYEPYYYYYDYYNTRVMPTGGIRVEKTIQAYY